MQEKLVVSSWRCAVAGRERREKEWGLAVAPILDVVLGTTREMLHRVDFWGRSLPFCGRLRFAVVFLNLLRFFTLGAAVT